jgi:hypothetical protein
MKFASICRGLMIGALAILSLALVLSATNAYADWNIKTIGSCQTIREPWSYAVDKTIVATLDNLQPVPGAPRALACIVIDADFVTLNLQGYTIFGPGSGLGVAAVGKVGIKVHSGSITNFGEGVHLSGRGHTVEHINAANNNTGINVGPSGGNRVIGNMANDNGVGIQVVCPSVVLGNMATGNLVDMAVDPVTCTRSHNSPKAGDDVPPLP